MMQLFQEKQRARSWVAGATRTVLIVLILLCSGTFPSRAGSPDSVTPPKSRVTIQKIAPEAVYPGDSIEIFLDAEIPEYQKDDIRVYFDQFLGRVLLVGLDALKVQVPEDVNPGDRVWVVVMTGTSKTPPFRITVQSPLTLAKLRTGLLKLFSDPFSIPVTSATFWAGVAILLVVLLRKPLRGLVPRQVMVSPPEALEVSDEISPTEAAEVEPKIEPLQVPAELAAACRKRECVVFAGAGFSKLAGLPAWHEFVDELLQWARDSGILDPNLAISYRGALHSGQADLVADGVANAVRAAGGPQWDKLLEHLRAIFAAAQARPTPAHRLLRKIGFTGAMTTNLDSLLEQALEAPVLTPRDTQNLPHKLASQEPFVLKLFGALESPESVQISPARYRDTVADNRVFLEFIEKLFVSRTVLFIGTSLDDVQSNLEALRLRNVRRPHYALAGVSGSEWPAKAESLQRRFNVQVLPYPAGDGDKPLVDFLDALAAQAAGERGAAAAATQRERPCLKRIHLENIGPYEALDLELDPKWNILLGDNGVGKSNILKAIALALSGKHAQQFADRLIKFGRPSGRITLELTDGAINVTELFRTTSEPEIKVVPQRELLGTERWLAMGFPPLRQVGWTLPKGPRPRSGAPYATPGDVLPLVSGDLDPRMTDLKQSILNFDYQSHGEGGEHYRKLMDDFFDTIGQVTRGVTLRKGHIDRQTWQIIVETDDGEVPLAAVSQGTQSLMGWIGLLLQRLYEVYDTAENPREGPALVLIDEIDAHMHPNWQQTIVQNLSKLFPNVQFIATTHSPLIVGGMPVSQVARFKRDEKGAVVQARIDEDMTRGRADQILTGDLFELPTTLALGEKTNKLLADYEALLGRSELTDGERKRFAELHRELAGAIPPSAETKLERRAQELATAVLRADFKPEKLAEIQQSLRSVARKVAESLGWEDFR